MQLKFVLIVLFATILFASKLPLDASEAHHQADTVLYPAFVAAVNDWVNNHPKGEEHYQKFDKHDKERFDLAKKRWHDVEAAMKRAGY